MIRRQLKLSKTNSFFLFGPRGSGKSTLLKEHFSQIPHVWIDLLNIDNELRFRKDPELLSREYLALDTRPKWIVIDEVQKVPKILDVVHRLIEEEGVLFALTGSSARKLKNSQANLLAGRAFDFSLFPFSFGELNEQFNLEDVLRFGSLPKLYSSELVDIEDKKRFLKSYVSTYLKEEVVVEQLVRNIEPFHRFLEVAAQMSGEILNYSSIGKKANVADKSVARYYEILHDTLMGLILPPYHKSVRKQQIESPRFYFFDTGVIRAIRNDLKYELNPHTYEYGKLFESFIIMEIHKLNNYHEADFNLSYLKSKDGAEIDLIVCDKRKTFLIEIKSSEVHHKEDIRHLSRFIKDIPGSQGIVLCSNQSAVQLDTSITAYPWKEGLLKIFKAS